MTDRFRRATVALPPLRRGFHLVTDRVRDAIDLSGIEVGLLHVFCQHTSASVTINENYDADVRGDLERHFSHSVPERAPYYQHTLEGPDDMPAHIKTVTVGCDVTIPIEAGRLCLGTWQGIYLGEHRDHADGRRLILTAYGQAD